MKQQILDTGNLIAVSAPDAKHPANAFDMSSNRKFSCNMGVLYPFKVREVVPGDQWTQAPEVLVRMQPMVAPVMHAYNIRTETFFVPNRLLFDQWADFIAPNPGDPTIVLPYFANIGVTANTMSNYIELPIATCYDVSAMPFAACQKVYSDWYRDVLINTAEFQIMHAGLQTARFDELNALHNRNWDKDYFTSARPQAQAGPDVIIPSITSTVPVHTTGTVASALRQSPSGAYPAPGNISTDALGYIRDAAGDALFVEPALNLGITPAEIALHGGTIEELRRASRLQEFLEAETAGGTTYYDSTKAHFGVSTSDLRAQRAEYLGGTNQPMTISEVLNTTGATGGLPQGTMAGHGVSHHSHGRSHYKAEEHGFLVTFLSILPRPSYTGGLRKMFSRKDRFDFLWPEFAQLGYQPILNKELVVSGTVGDNDPFGYVPRYTEYRMDYDTVSGDFATNLAFWHDARMYTGFAPPLSQSFLECNPATQNLNRIFAVTDPTVQHFLVEVQLSAHVWRILPRLVHPTL